MSARILEFARPLFAALAPEPTADQARRILALAIPVWNAQIQDRVLAQRGAAAELIEDLRRRAKEGETPEMAFLVAQLFQRKAELFPDDVRQVGTHEVRESDDGSWQLFVQPLRE